MDHFAARMPSCWTAEPGVVDVGLLDLSTSTSVGADALSTEESSRAAAFRFALDRERYIRSHVWVRNVIGRYLRMSPKRIAFDYEERGKPYLGTDAKKENLQFNLAHSGEFAILAISLSNRVGVDIERIDAGRDHVQIARRFFSREEVRQLEDLPAHKHVEAFFACWTRKEALLKALGMGLAFPLSGFSVTVSPEESVAITEAPSELASLNWWLSDIAAPEGYRAALALEGGPSVIRKCAWDYARE